MIINYPALSMSASGQFAVDLTSSFELDFSIQVLYEYVNQPSKVRGERCPLLRRVVALYNNV